MIKNSGRTAERMRKAERQKQTKPVPTCKAGNECPRLAQFNDFPNEADEHTRAHVQQFHGVKIPFTYALITGACNAEKQKKEANLTKQILSEKIAPPDRPCTPPGSPPGLSTPLQQSPERRSIAELLTPLEMRILPSTNSSFFSGVSAPAEILTAPDVPMVPVDCDTVNSSLMCLFGGDDVWSIPSSGDVSMADAQPDSNPLSYAVLTSQIMPQIASETWESQTVPQMPSSAQTDPMLVQTTMQMTNAMQSAQASPFNSPIQSPRHSPGSSPHRNSRTINSNSACISREHCQRIVKINGDPVVWRFGNLVRQTCYVKCGNPTWENSRYCVDCMHSNQVNMEPTWCCAHPVSLCNPFQFEDGHLTQFGICGSTYDICTNKTGIQNACSLHINS